MNLGVIKIQLEDLQFYPLTNDIKSYNLKSESDHRLIMRAVYPISVEYETDLGWKRLSDCRELQMTQDNCVILKFEGDFYHYTNYEGKVELRQKRFKCDVIYEKEDMELYEKLGELEFLKSFNSFRYKNIVSEKNRLRSDLQQFNEDEPQFESIDQQIQKLDRWIKEYLRWFLDYGFEIPGIKTIHTIDHNQLSLDKKKEWKGNKTDLIEECLRRYVRVEFESLIEAFRWAASEFRIKGENLEAYQLQSYFETLKSKGTFFEVERNFFRKQGKIERRIE